MKLWGMEPVLEDAVIEKSTLRRDLKHSRSVEQYRVGELALYIPGRMFFWRYLPLSEVRGVIIGRRDTVAKELLLDYALEQPDVRILHRDGTLIIPVQSFRNAQILGELLNAGHQWNRHRGKNRNKELEKEPQKHWTRRK